MVGTRGAAAAASSNGGSDRDAGGTSRAQSSPSSPGAAAAGGNDEKGGNLNTAKSLPAKRSLSDRSRSDDGGGSSSCVTAPSSPGSQPKGRATRSNSNAVPPSPSRNTRAARASARANAKERTASDESPSLAADEDGTPSPDSSASSNGGRSSKRAKLDHPPPFNNGGAYSTTADANADADAASVPAKDGGAVVSPINTSSNGGKDQDQTAAAGGGLEEDESRSSTPTHKNTTNGGGSATSIAEVPPPPPPPPPAASQSAAPSNAAAEDGDNSTTSASTSASASRPQSPPPPLKSLTMQHLRKKYLQELEYMSVEFRKLEKQLLGARGGGGGGGGGSGGGSGGAPAPSAETAASRERREKLHSFIVHLEDTIQQIKDGCQAELATASSTDASTDDKTTVVTSADEDHPATTSAADTITSSSSNNDDDKAKRDFANSAALTKLTREKEQEETVQKLEEHILANLLPVKVRLTKQLAAQQGATRNPAGMPTSARGPRPSAAAISGGKGTFAAAAEERRKREEAARLAATQQRQDSSSSSLGGAATEESTTPPLQPPPAPSILGKPLKGGGSSLTARLHGATLGSKARPAGHGVGQAQPAVQSPRAKEPGMTKIASTTTEDSFDSTSGESGQPKRKILFAGMTPGSEQVSSSVSAAQGAHKMVVTDPTLRAAHRAGLAAEAIEEGAGALTSLASSKVPPPPPAPRGGKAKASIVRPAHPGAPKPALVVTSGSDSSNDTVAARGASTRSSTASSRSTSVPAGPASAAVAKVQAQQVATAAQLAARAKARAAAGLPPLDTPVTSSAAAELRLTGKKSTANRGKKRRLSEKNLTDEEKERLIRRRDRRQRRRKKAKRLERERIRHAAFAAQARQAQAQQSAAAVAAAAAAVAEQNKAETSKQGGAAAKAGSGKSPSSPSSDKKVGPRTVEYICGLCNEVYVSTCDANPWWCLRQQDCPKCGKRQVPRIDISAPANSIQYHPALLAHAEDSSSGGSGGGASVPLRAKGPAPSAYIPGAHLAPPPKFPDLSELYESESEASDDDEAVSLEGDSSDESDDDDGLKTYNGNLSPAERAEAEDFGTDYAGPKLKDNEASRLLILMGHAQCCPGRHKVGKMREVCQNTKFMMMHVRDCPGTTSTFDVCPFPWCRKVKHLLYHLVSCEKPEECSICTPTDIPPTLKALRGLNAHRHKKHREKLRAAAAAAASARAAAPKAPPPSSYVNAKKGATVASKLPISKHPPTSKYASSAKPGIARHPGGPVPNPTLSSKSSAKVTTTVAGKATAVQPRHPGHPGTSRPGTSVAKSAMAAKASNHVTAKVQVSKPMAPRHPGAPTNALNKEVPVPLRGSTPNPILPTDSMEDSGIVAKTSVVPPNRPATKSPIPLPVSNPLEPPKSKAAGAIINDSATEKKVAGASPSVGAKGGNSAKTPTPPPARGDTPPENGCAGQAVAKAPAESARLVEE